MNAHGETPKFDSPNAGEKPAQLLVIDDDNVQRMILRQLANQVGYHTTGAVSYEEAVDLLGQGDFDCIILDISLGRRSGIDILHLFERIHCTTPIIIVSGADEDVCKMALEVGRKANLNMRVPMPKPVNLKILGDELARIRQQSDARPATSITLTGWVAEPKSPPEAA